MDNCEMHNIKKLFLISLITFSFNSFAEEIGDWDYGYFVDEFDDPTDTGYLRIITYGKFSNVATEGSDLRVHMLLSEDDFSNPRFTLYEYNRSNPLKGSYTSKIGYWCGIKDASGEVDSTNLYLYWGRDYLIFDSNDESKEKFLELIKSESSVKFSCFEKLSPSTKYRFDLDFKYYNTALRMLTN